VLKTKVQSVSVELNYLIWVILPMLGSSKMKTSQSIKSFVLLPLFFVMTLFTTQAWSTPVALTSSDFTTSILIDFNLGSNAVAIGSLYSASGVTFSGALLGLTTDDVALFPSSGGVIASNWNYTSPIGCCGSSAGQSFTATFSSSIFGLGFFLENDPGQTATVEFFSGVTSLGTLALEKNTSLWPNLTPEFRGFGDTSGFDKIVFTNSYSGDGNGFFAIDDMRIASAPAIPEPETYVMMLTGIGLIGFMSLRRKKSHA
jgi:hypothetical protein